MSAVNDEKVSTGVKSKVVLKIEKCPHWSDEIESSRSSKVKLKLSCFNFPPFTIHDLASNCFHKVTCHLCNLYEACSQGIG